MSRRTIAVDFDGVLHQYRKKLSREEQHLVLDPPVPGALEWVNETLEHFDVVVYTARHIGPGGLEAVKQWLMDWGFPDLPVYGQKPPAILYIDDRGYQFDGYNWPSVDFMKTFQPWNRPTIPWGE